MSNVYITRNPLWNEQAEQGEAAYGEDFDTKVGFFDMVRHPKDSLLSAPRDQQSPPLRQPLAALGNSQRVAAVAGVRKQKRERDLDHERAQRIHRQRPSPRPRQGNSPMEA